MDINTSFLLSLSILIPLIAGIIRFKKLGNTYLPFFILLILGFAAELASNILIYTFKVSNAPVIKIYSLFECCLVLYQLQLWRNWKKDKQLFVFLYIACIIFWFIESIVFANINTFSPYFRVFYAFVLILLSITQINSMMFNHEGSLLKNPRFILCLSFTIIFLYQILVEASFFIGSDKSVVANKIIIGWDYINFIINLMFAVAIYFINGKEEEGYNKYLMER